MLRTSTNGGSSSSSSSSSSESDSGIKKKKKRKKETLKFKLFNPKASQEDYSWELNKQLEQFFHKYCEEFIADKDMAESVLEDMPVPSNITSCKQIDVNNLLKEKTNGLKVLKADKDMLRFTKKVTDTMGPLGKACQMVEDFRADESAPPIDIEDIAEQLQRTVICLGQATGSIMYQRHLSILSCFMESVAAKSLLKNNKDELEKTKDVLFGEKFKNELKSTMKATNEANAFFNMKDMRKSEKPSSYSSSTMGHLGFVIWENLS